jgi:predicted PurR-regulated permease PerM
LKHISLKPAAAEARVQSPTPELEPARVRHFMRRNSVANITIALVALAVALHFMQVVCVIVCVSILLAFVLDPLVQLLQKLHIPRAIAAFVAMLILCGVFYGISLIFYGRAVAFANQLPTYSAEARQFISKYTEKVEELTQAARDTVPQRRGTQTIRITQQPSIWGEIGSGVGTATELAFSVSFIPFLAYFMMTWKDHARRSTVLLFPKEMRAGAYDSLGRIADMIRAFIVGNLLVGLFISVASTAVFGLIGIPYFYFIGFLSGFLSLLPYLGVLLALLPPTLAGLGSLHEGGYLVILLTVFGLHLFSLNVLYPKFIGKRLQLNPLAVTLALLFWGWLWGAMGLILAVPLTAAMKVVFDHIESMNAFGAWLGD